MGLVDYLKETVHKPKPGKKVDKKKIPGLNKTK